jgi:hypothetical protein
MKRSKRGSRTPANRANADDDEPNFYDAVTFPPLLSLTNPVQIHPPLNPTGRILNNLHSQQPGSDGLLQHISGPVLVPNTAAPLAASATMSNMDSGASAIRLDINTTGSTSHALQLLLGSIIQTRPEARPLPTVASVARLDPSIYFDNNQQLDTILLQQSLGLYPPNSGQRGSYLSTSEQPQIHNRVLSQFYPAVATTSVIQQPQTQVTDPALLQIIESLARILGSGSGASAIP